MTQTYSAGLLPTGESISGKISIHSRNWLATMLLNSCLPEREQRDLHTA